MDIYEKENKQKLTLKMLLDDHYAATLLAAIAVGRVLNIDLSQCLKNLRQNFHLPRSRIGVIPGIHQSTIIDSSYNASGRTMVNALRLLNKIASGRKVAVIGDMRELGEIGKVEHQDIAKVAHKNCDVIVTVGPLMKRWCVPKLKSLGFKSNNLFAFDNAYQAVDVTRKLIRKGDTVLVKGSQNTIFLEIVVEALMQNKEDSEKLLCRRGSFWEKKRLEVKN